jgi:hypothetical protein
VANKTYTKKNQEKLRVYLEKIKKDDPKPLKNDKETKNVRGVQNNISK